MEKETAPEWGRGSLGDLSQRWPRDPSGQPEEPVFLLLGVWEEGDLADFLTRCQAVRVELDGWINLYEIPSQRVLFEAMGSV